MANDNVYDPSKISEIALRIRDTKAVASDPAGAIATLAYLVQELCVYVRAVESNAMAVIMGAAGKIDEASDRSAKAIEGLKMLKGKLDSIEGTVAALATTPAPVAVAAPASTPTVVGAMPSPEEILAATARGDGSPTPGGAPSMSAPPVAASGHAVANAGEMLPGKDGSPGMTAEQAVDFVMGGVR